MLRAVLRPQARSYSTGKATDATKRIASFLAQEDRYLFEGEALTDEQNRAAIPTRPQTKNVSKIHYEMLAPKHVADVFSRPTVNDKFVTTLTAESPLFGDESYTVVPKSKNKSPTTVKLLFGNIVADYMNTMNSQVKALRSIPDDFLAPTITKEASEKISHRLPKGPVSEKAMAHLLQSTEAIKNSQQMAAGRVDFSVLPTLITVDKVVVHLLQQQKTKNFEELEVILHTVKKNLPVLTQDALRRIIETLVNETYENTHYIEAVCAFLRSDILSLPYYTSMMQDLHPVLLDKLSCFFSASDDPSTASEFLRVIVSHGFCCSSNALSAFMLSYANQLENSEYPDARSEFKRTVAPLKAVIVSQPLSHTTAQVLLKHSVWDVTDLDQFLGLMHEQHNHEALQTVAAQIIDKVDEVVPQTRKSLVLTTIIKRFQQDKVDLSAEAKTRAAAIYAAVNPANGEYLMSN